MIYSIIGVSHNSYHQHPKPHRNNIIVVSSPSCHAPWAKDSLDNFKQFLGSAELASSENETTNQIALFAIRNSIT